MIEINEYLLSGLVLVVILLSIAVVACIVKVVRLTESLQEHMDRVDRVHREMGLREEESMRLLRDTNRDINMVEKTLMNRINQEHRKLTALENRLAADLDELASSASPEH
jgi:transcriptional regulator